MSTPLEPDGDARLEGVPRSAPIHGPDGAYYGHEWARWRHDTLDARVDDLLRPTPSGARVLDLGCATGSRAAAFARMGCDVTALDILDRSEEIAARTADRTGGTARQAGTITFVQADLRTWAAPPGAPWRLIHARRVISFMTDAEAGALFARLRPCCAAESVLALSFIATGLASLSSTTTGPAQGGPVKLLPGFYGHDVRDITQRLEAAGFLVTEAFSDGLCDAGLLARPAPDVRRPLRLGRDRIERSCSIFVLAHGTSRP